jgi:hypothetical protein
MIMKNVKVNFFSLVAVFMLPALFVTEALAFDDAGRVMFVAGKATIVNAAGLARYARKGDVLKQGDRLVTSDKGMIQIKMRDDGIMAVRPDTDLKLNDMVTLDKMDRPSQTLVLWRGGVRVLTGDNERNKLGYLIKTAATSIGLRDGDTEALVIPAPKPAAQHGSDSTPAGTYNRVYAGKGIIQGAAGKVLNLAANQISYTPSVREAPVLVASLPPSYIDTVIPTRLAGDTKPTLVAAPAPVLATPIIAVTPINAAPPTLVSLAPLPVALAPVGVTTPPPVMIAPPTLVINPILVTQPVVIAPPPPPQVITVKLPTTTTTPPTIISTRCIKGVTC